MKVVALLLSVLLVAAVRGSDPQVGDTGSPSRSEASDGNIKASKGQYLCFSLINKSFLQLGGISGVQDYYITFFYLILILCYYYNSAFFSLMAIGGH